MLPGGATLFRLAHGSLPWGVLGGAGRGGAGPTEACMIRRCPVFTGSCFCAAPPSCCCCFALMMAVAHLCAARANDDEAGMRTRRAAAWGCLLGPGCRHGPLGLEGRLGWLWFSRGGDEDDPHDVEEAGTAKRTEGPSAEAMAAKMCGGEEAAAVQRFLRGTMLCRLGTSPPLAFLQIAALVTTEEWDFCFGRGRARHEGGCVCDAVGALAAAELHPPNSTMQPCCAPRSP